MAGDWIKMRSDLHTHPKVVRIASALKADRLRVVGGLHAVWCLFDVHSEDGILDGYTVDALDDLIGFSGFASALVNVGWLESADDHLVIPRFDEHNGQSAKRRAQETQRKREARSASASDADNLRSREEKRREEKKPKQTPVADALFADFWEQYPRKVSKAEAEKAFAKLRPDAELLVMILEGLDRSKNSDQWAKDGGQFIPHASTWLNKRRWEDEPEGHNVRPLFAGEKYL